MEPNIWGPAAWLFLHSVTFQYPENPSHLDKEKYYTFFRSIQNVLPCPNCREHYKQNLKDIPIRLDSREDLVEWLIDVHNEVNKKNYKRELSYEEVYKNYNQLYKEDSSESNYNVWVLFIIILLILLILYYKYTLNN